ncbi:hypothetical protein AB0M46_05590 [Dactylosporangium sp. NPDC051485]|uniref:hypothetical protein n=1 Tax=Dactylosporangium sp. NPDC051485 TaxID=3154846 RepID=UPI00343324E1
MTTTGTETPEDARHTDTALVDELTAYLNSTYEPSGGDLMELVCQLISGSGRPLLDERWDFDAEVSEDRHGLLTGTVTAGRYTIRVTQPTDISGDLHIDVTTTDPDDADAQPDDFGLAITIDGRRLLDPMTCTWRSTVPADLQLTEETRR